MSHRFKCFMDHPCHPVCPDSLPIRHPLNELHRYLQPILPPLLVLERLNTWTSIHYRRPPLTAPTISVFKPSTCSPGPCRPLHPRAAIPFRPPLPPSGLPPFSDLDVTSVPSNPCGFAIIGSVLPPPFLEPLLTPADLDLRPSPCWSQGVCVVLLVCPRPLCIRLSLPLCRTVF